METTETSSRQRRITRSRGAVRSLHEVRSYKNPRIVRGFLRNYRMPKREANRLFREVLKFLWLCATVPAQQKVEIFGFQKLFDEMWHAFVLHTRDYAIFCDEYLGGMV